MPSRRHHVRFLSWIAFLVGPLAGAIGGQNDDQPANVTSPTIPSAETSIASDPAAARDLSVEELVRQVKPATVVLLGRGRDGATPVSGTGFLISADGLVATNLHVIGEGRPFTVRTAEGKELPVTAVHASDRHFDLAILRVEGVELPHLTLGTEEGLPQGASVVALGHPHGLNYSVVQGVLSSRREMEGREMLQLAIPIEPGNSGGPLMDRQGHVHGILTMKSLVTENLGFAVSVRHLRQLLERPNPVPRDVWLRRGTLDTEKWEPLFGANWRQLPARLTVDEPGNGFGGRSLCLAKQPLPALPYEVGVAVRLGDESGAAGLVFHADGGERHYGFYPTNGSMRLTRFDGPNVFSWNILHDAPTAHYQTGEWNYLKVRLEENKITCFVNDHQVLESTDTEWTSGRVGLAKFRETTAEFKDFVVAAEIPSRRPSADMVDRIAKSLDETLTGKQAELATADNSPAELAKHALITRQLVDQRITTLEQEIVRLRQVANNAHVQDVVTHLMEEVGKEAESASPGRLALWIAKLDNPDLNIEDYTLELDRMANEVQAELPADAGTDAKLHALDKLLFEHYGFHGSRVEYYTAENSYLNRVLDDREGLPITLSVLYLELGRRLDIPLEGVGLPGHFVVRYRTRNGPSANDGEAGQEVLIDVFDGGKRLSRGDADAQIAASTGRPARDEDLAPYDTPAIGVRMLRNLINVARTEGDRRAMERYLDATLAIDPKMVEERLLRVVLRHETGRRDAALADIDWLLTHGGDSIDQQAIEQLRDQISNAP